MYKGRESGETMIPYEDKLKKAEKILGKNVIFLRSFQRNRPFFAVNRVPFLYAPTKNRALDKFLQKNEQEFLK